MRGLGALAAIGFTPRLPMAMEDFADPDLQAWTKLSGGQKIDFFEEMVELAYYSGALRQERPALRVVWSDDKST